jgi:carbon starvation protein
MSTWSLIRFIRAGVISKTGEWQLPKEPVPWVAMVLIGLALLLLIEAIRVFASSQPPSAGTPEIETALPVAAGE